MSKPELHPEYYRQKAALDTLLARRNAVDTTFYNGIYERWQNPVLTREMIPLEWRYDLNPETNPYFMERLGVNAVFNAGAIEMNGRFCIEAEACLQGLSVGRRKTEDRIRPRRRGRSPRGGLDALLPSGRPLGH